MQLGIHRNGDKPGPPDSKESDPILWVVLHDQRHAVPGVKAELFPQRARESRHLFSVFAVGGNNVLAIGEGW